MDRGQKGSYITNDDQIDIIFKVGQENMLYDIETKTKSVC